MSSAQTRWARALVSGLSAAGVSDVVLSPGSRSTPLVLAALEAGLRIHNIVDERVASFFALGLARASGRPPVLMCTSGSAAGHYLPAVMEASAAFVPLLVLSADRPPELQGGGANQTGDQLKLFGDAVRRFFDLGTAYDDGIGLRAASRLASQAALTSTWPRPGPVHLNARFRKPFESPTEPEDLHSPRLLGPTLRAHPDALRLLVDKIRSAKRPMLTLGPATPRCALDHRAVASIERAGVGVMSDVTSGYRFGEAGGGSLAGAEALMRIGQGRQALSPDLIVQVGATPIGSAWLKLLEASSAEHVVVDAFGFPDPLSTASTLIVAEPAEVLSALAAELEPRPLWCHALSEQLARARGKLLDSALTHATAVFDAIRSLPDGGQLMLGNSLSVRLADLFGEATHIDVLHQRGLSGIDGIISGAAGAAVASQKPTLVLLGDVSFVHDVGGLAVLREVRSPIQVVVLNDRGGRIFEQLPVSSTLDRAAFEAHFAMSPSLDIGQAAASQGIAHRRVNTRAELQQTLQEPGGPRVVEVMLPEGGGAEVLQRLDSQVRQALS